ncbi:MAG: secondary thiamine-phosphate synthase enzyme YjbQ [Bacteroidetes bacterium]|nr:secondary thiamine-phosphate synthase enzyme YjbQ [Bacteroidota bacterium]
MKIETKRLPIATKGHNDLTDITSEIVKYLNETGMQEGNVLIFAPGSTAGVTTIEYEPGLIQDYPEFFEKIIPSQMVYHHDETWHDANGYSHIRAALQGASLTVPFYEGKLLLGTWQQIVLIDFDNRSRNRNVVLQFTGI